MSFRRSALFAAVNATLSAAASITSCTGNPPTYLVQKDILRVIPDQGTVPSAGGSMFVLVELTRDDDASTAPVITYVAAQGATLSTLPGPLPCATFGAQDGGGLGPDASDAAPALGQQAASPGSLTIPYSSMLQDTARSNVQETGVLLSIPAGQQDVLVTATAYSYQGSSSACSASPEQLIAIGSATIVRASATPEASAGDSSASSDALEGSSSPTDSSSQGDVTTDGILDGPLDGAGGDAGTADSPPEAD